jgi:hypothetical protein
MPLAAALVSRSDDAGMVRPNEHARLWCQEYKTFGSTGTQSHMCARSGSLCAPAGRARATTLPYTFHASQRVLEISMLRLVSGQHQEHRKLESQPSVYELR